MAAAPIAELDHDQLHAVEQAIHDPPNNLFGPVRRWDLALVLLGERPACRLISTRDLVSSRGVAELRNRPEEFARGDFLGQLLRECGLPYSIRFPHQCSTDSSTLYATYYVASTPERFELLPDPYSTSPDEQGDTWMNRPRKLGQFLGYPADAIDAYEANACSGNWEWTELISESKIDRLVGAPVSQLYDRTPLPYATILDAVLPYTPPLPSFGTSKEHFRRAVSYLEAGVEADQYGIRPLRYLLDYHRRNQ